MDFDQPAANFGAEIRPLAAPASRQCISCIGNDENSPARRRRYKNRNNDF